MDRRIKRWLGVFGLAGLGWLVMPASAQEKPGSAAQDLSKAAANELPGMTIDREKRTIDVQSEVCLVEGALELIATVRSGKEHEALIVVKARPQHIHLGLLLLGLEPGAPGRWEKVGDKYEPKDPVGDPVSLRVIYEKDGKTMDRPIGEWALNPKSSKTLGDAEYIFAGSRIAQPKKGEPFYAADVAGDVISLVTFDDEMLALPRAASKANDHLEWVANKAEMPPIGTRVTLRIIARPKKAAAPQP